MSLSYIIITIVITIIMIMNIVIVIIMIATELILSASAMPGHGENRKRVAGYCGLFTVEARLGFKVPNGSFRT